MALVIFAKNKRIQSDIHSINYPTISFVNINNKKNLRKVDFFDDNTFTGSLNFSQIRYSVRSFAYASDFFVFVHFASQKASIEFDSTFSTINAHCPGAYITISLKIF